MPTCSQFTELSHRGSTGFGDGQVRLYDAPNALKRELARIFSYCGFGIICEPPKIKMLAFEISTPLLSNIDRHSVESNILMRRTKIPGINRDTAVHWSDIFVPIINCHQEKFRFFKFGMNFI